MDQRTSTIHSAGERNHLRERVSAAQIEEWPDRGQRVAIEVELAQKSLSRLRATLNLHADWRAAGKSAGVIYVCNDAKGCARIRKRAAEAGLRPGKSGGFRVEPLETVKVATVAASCGNHRVAARIGGPDRSA